MLKSRLRKPGDGVSPQAPTRGMAILIAGAYGLIGSSWILLSGYVLHRLVHDPAQEALLETLKGWFYVGVTATGLGVALDRYFRTIRLSTQRLKESEERWQFALEGAGQGLWEWDIATGKVYYSRRWKAILGYASHEIGDESSEWESRIHPEDRERVLADLKEHLEGRVAEYSSEHRMRCKDGGYVWILDRAHVVSRAENGEALRMLGTHEDISQRRRVEDALRRSEARYRMVAEYGSDVIWLFDLALGKFAYVSPAVHRLRGFTVEEVLAQGMEDALTPESYAKVAAGLSARLAAFEAGDDSVRSQVHEVSQRCKDGGTVLTEVVTTLITDKGRKVTHIQGITRDISERKRAEARTSGLASLGFRLSTVRDPFEAGKAIADIALGLFEWDACFLDLYDEKQDKVIQLINVDTIKGERKTVERNLPGDRPTPLMKRVMLRGGELMLRDNRPDEELTVRFGDAERRSMSLMFVPVRNHGASVGVFSVQSYRMRAYTTGDLEALQGLADHCGEVLVRLQAEQRLREREEQFRLFVDHSPAAIAMLDREMRYLVVSRRWLTDYRLGDRSIIGRTHYDVFPEVPERWRATHRRCLEGAVERCDQDAFPRADGGVDWVRWEIRPWRDASGGVGGILILSELITDRVRAEAALRQSETEFRAMFELASIGMAQADPATGRFLRANQRLCTILGYSLGELLSMRVSDVTCLEDRERDHLQFMSLARGERSYYRAEKRYLRKDGKIVWGSVNVSLIRDPSGGPIRTIATVEDITERRVAEERLKQLSRAVEQSPASIVITDLEGRIEYANPRFTQTTGYTFEEVVGANPRVLKSGKMPQAYYAELWRTILSGREWRGELHNRRKNGGLFWEYASISPILNEEKAITHFVAVKEDITERKRLEATRQALLSLGDRLNCTTEPMGAGRALLEAADALWTWDSATLDLLAPGGTLAEPVLRVDMIGGIRKELPLEHASEPPSARMRQVTEHGPQLILRELGELVGPDGGEMFGDVTRRSASIMCVPIRREAATVGVLSIQSYSPRAYNDDDLEILQALADYCGGAVDRIRSEDRLRQSEERYRGLVETTFDWIWEVDAEGRYTYASPKVQELLGYKPEEVLGRTPFDLMPEEEARKIRVVFGEIALARKSFSALENTNRHKDGHMVVLETSGVPVLSLRGEFLGYRGMDRDVTERKRLEGELRQAQKLEAIGQLAGGVAHDFNNILAAIMMHLGLLQLNAALDKETRNSLKELDAEARRAAGITRQLLMFSRRSVLAVQPLDLNEVIANLLKMLGRLIGEHVNMRFDGQTNLPLVEADAGMMEQVLMNLVVNARDAMPKGGRVTIATSVTTVDADMAQHHPDRREGQFVCLSVADTGCGMSAATLKRVFEPFFTTKDAGKGTGLGLATVYGLVAQHKGWVEVESALGKGSCFRVLLPALALAASPSATSVEAAPPPRGKETILLVEDERTVRRLIGQSLRALGYTVHEAGNGQQAMALWQLHGSKVDLLLTDMVMPEGMTGLELSQQLQALKPGLKVIISSGYSAEMVQAGIPTMPGVSYLPKPYEAKVLADVVRQSLDSVG